MPQLYDLYGDKTFDSLNKKSSSLLKYEQLILGPALAYLYDAVQFSDDTLELLEHQDTQHVSAQEIGQRVYETHNMVMGGEGNGVNKAELEAQTRIPHRISLYADGERAQTGLAVGLAPVINVLGTTLPGSNVPSGHRAEGAYSTGERTAKEGSSARGRRHCGDTAVGLAWGGVLDLKLEARGFWRDELRHLHITHLDLEAVFKTVQAFLREPRRKVWWDPHCEGVDSLAYDWRGEANWINPPGRLLDEEGVASAASQPVPAKGARLEVYWMLDDDWYEVSDTGQDHIQYGNGDEEWLLLLSEELTRPEQQQVTEENDDVALERALKETARGYYGPKAKNFKDFGDGEGREWLPASEETVRLYLAALLQKGGIQATSMQLYLSAINNYHEDMGWPGPAKGRSENVLMDEEGVTVVLTREKGRIHKLKKRQLSIPWQLLEAAGRQSVHARTGHRPGNEWLQRVLGNMVCVPPDRGHFSTHSTRKGATTCARAVGVVMEKVRFLRGWAQLSAAVQTSIDPTTVPDQAMRGYFGWLAPPSVRTQGRSG
ncbi:hypothetical protein CYMTET_35118, partial [Cymbomonas tetramitiformis]